MTLTVLAPYGAPARPRGGSLVQSDGDHWRARGSAVRARPSGRPDIRAAHRTCCPPALGDTATVTPATMARIATVNERFQSYNIEMVEVTGGRFWRPYGPNKSDADSDLYAWRPPIDLTNPRLRMLASALAPAYMRVSGTWANATWFADSDTAPSAPSAGFNGVLSRRQWRGVIDFAQSVGAGIVTSFAISRAPAIPPASGRRSRRAASRLHRRGWRRDRRRRIHERAEPRCDGRSTGRL